MHKTNGWSARQKRGIDKSAKEWAKISNTESSPEKVNWYVDEDGEVKYREKHVK